MTQASQATIHRAAILVAALEPDLADRLLDRMPADEAARVRRAIMELGDVEASQERDVIDAFLSREMTATAAPSSQNDRADSAAQTSEDEGVELHISSASSNQSASDDGSSAVPPFQFLYDVERADLVDLLLSEHPQTIAIVASHLPEDRAASLLAALLPAARDEVMRRFAESGVTDSAVLGEMERSLRARLAAGRPSGPRNPADLQRISRVLSAADAETRQQTQTPDATSAPASVRESAALAADRDPLAMTFADLEYLDEALLSATLRRADAELVRLALAGATAAFVQKVLNRLSLREARNLRRQIETLGPTRLSDMERAQRELAHLAETVLIEALQTSDASQGAAR